MRARISKKKVIEAVVGSGGIMVVIAERLGRTRQQVYNYINENPDIKKIFEEEREKIVDVAEAKLIQKLKNDENWAISMVLKTLGKTRGYTEALEVKGQIENKIPTPADIIKEYRNQEQQQK